MCVLLFAQVEAADPYSDLAPAFPLQEALRIASDYAQKEKLDVPGVVLSSLSLEMHPDGTLYWKVRWVPARRFMRGGDVTLEIAMDRSLKPILGK